MKKYFKFIILIIIVLLILLVFFNISKNNVECTYMVNYDDYNIKYKDTFYYNEDNLTEVKHTIIYEFDKDSIKDVNQIYNQLMTNYQNYNDIELTTDLSDKKIIFDFKFNLETTTDNRYYELLGLKKDFVVNGYKDDLIKRYKLDYSDSSCRMIK